MEFPRGLARTSHPASAEASIFLILVLALAMPGCQSSSSSSSVAVVAINEIMAGGATRPQENVDGTLLVDDQGQPADWVEVYNPLSRPVNLSGSLRHIFFPGPRK